MYLIDLDKETSIRSISLYLTTAEANELLRKLNNLLEDPEANEHFHLHDSKGKENEISCSLITEKKLKNLNKYNEIERRILSEE